MTNTIADMQEADVILITGSNTTENHPVISSGVKRAVTAKGAKLIVVDPRRIRITRYADKWLRQNLGTDVVWINGLMHVIIKEGLHAKEFIENRTEGFEELQKIVEKFTPDYVEQISGIPAQEIIDAARLYAKADRGCIIYCMGITQHTTGTDNVKSLANLAMLCGNMGIAGGGVNPLRGQNNVQGACDLGGLPNVYPAYQPVTSEEAQKKFREAWGQTSNTKVGLTATEIIPGVLEDKIHAIYILGEDPVMSDPDTHHVRECLSNVDFLVLQEIFPSETSTYADVLLPGVSFAEKTGTFTNTERRVQMVHQAIEPLGEAKPDWWITAEIAKRILAGTESQLPLNGPFASWDYPDTPAIMVEINALAPSYGGITHARLEAGERLQWPCPNEKHLGTHVLHAGKFARGLGHFNPIDHIPPAEEPSEDYPMVMSTGRVLYHWHGGEMTRRAKGLMEVYGETLVEVNPDDAAKMGINGKDKVRVTSRRGSIEAQAWVTDRVPPGMVYANFHFPEASANELTQAVLDPVAKIPEYKVTAVKVELVG